MLFPVPAAISCAIVSCGRYIRPQRCEQPVSPQGRWKGLCWHRSPYTAAPRPPAPREGRAGAAPAAWEFLHRRRACAAGCLAERAASEQPPRRRQGLRSRENMLPGSHRHHARKCVLWSLPHCYGNQVQGLGLTAAAGAAHAARLPSRHLASSLTVLHIRRAANGAPLHGALCWELPAQRGSEIKAGGDPNPGLEEGTPCPGPPGPGGKPIGVTQWGSSRAPPGLGEGLPRRMQQVRGWHRAYSGMPEPCRRHSQGC